MKPRTKLDRKILEIHKSLEDPITVDVKKWAIKTCLESKGIECKGEIYCFDCNRIFSAGNLTKNNKCPCCGVKLKIEKTKRKKHSQEAYFTVVDLKDNYQIIRHYRILRSIHIDKSYNNVMISRVVENYFNIDNGDVRTVAKQLLQGYSYMKMPFQLNSDMEIRSHNTAVHLIYGYVYPKAKIHPFFQKRGVRSNLHHIQPDLLFKELKYGNSQVETILKAKAYYILDGMIHNTYKLSRWWPQIKIAIRHKYKVKDLKMWFDHLEMLQANRKDIRNPKYILPANLKKEHQKLIDLNSKRRASQVIMKAREDNEAMERYIKSKGVFFGFHIEKGSLCIDPIKSIVEMAEEGEAMKHCVYSSRYYIRNVLILSAKVSGKRLATIELSLEDFQIKQIRGKCNSQVKEEPIIRELIQSNLIQLIKLKKVV